MPRRSSKRNLVSVRTRNSQNRMEKRKEMKEEQNKPSQNFEQQTPEEIFAQVYEDLQSRARSCMASSNGALTIQPTALVHEAWLKLESGTSQQWKNKAHFMGTAVRAMRCLLIDHARSRATQKRGGGKKALPLEDELLITDDNAQTFVRLDEALETLATLDRELASVVELRFFAGLTDQEIAASMEITTDQAAKAWAMARAWLRQRLATDHEEERKTA